MSQDYMHAIINILHTCVTVAPYHLKGYGLHSACACIESDMVASRCKHREGTAATNRPYQQSAALGGPAS